MADLGNGIVFVNINLKASISAILSLYNFNIKS